MTNSLADALPEELKRCRELSTEYAKIGPAGMFGKAMSDAAIYRAERAMMNGDLPAMIAAYQELQECE